jgi:hypothetical protein
MCGHYQSFATRRFGAKQMFMVGPQQKGELAIGSKLAQLSDLVGSRLAIGSICGGISVTVSPPDFVVDLFNFPVVEALGSF